MATSRGAENGEGDGDGGDRRGVSRATRRTLRPRVFFFYPVETVHTRGALPLDMGFQTDIYRTRAGCAPGFRRVFGFPNEHKD
jgi:hypothetical protein